MKIKNKTLKSLMAEYDIHVPTPEEPRELKMAEWVPQEVINNSDVSIDKVRSIDPTKNEEIGIVGTRYSGGRIRDEITGKYAPVQVRGSNSNPGLYWRYYTQNNHVQKTINNFRQIISSAKIDIKMPDAADPEMRQFVEFHRMKFKNLANGLKNFIEDASWMILFGFSVFEIVFNRDDQGRLYVEKFGYREQSSVDKWILDARGNDLLGIEFQTGGDFSRQYVLPKNKILLCTFNRKGNNYEGVAPLRSVLSWIEFERLLIQLSAVSMEKYGVPLTKVKREAGTQIPNPAKDEEVEDVYDIMSVLQAVEAGVIQLPDGVDIETMYPTGTTPDFESMIELCQRQILEAFSNEGSVLGLSSYVGSFALAEVSEDRALRAVPFIMAQILDPLNELLKFLAKDWFGEEQQDYPEFYVRYEGNHKNSNWLESVKSMFDVPVNQMPKAVQKEVYKVLELEWEEDQITPDMESNIDEEILDQAYDGSTSSTIKVPEKRLENNEDSFKPTQGMADAAQKALDWREEYGDEVSAGTRVGWVRANQLAKRENLTLETVKRMKSFFARHDGNQVISEENKGTPWKDSGYISWLLWGGDAGKSWSEKIVQREENKEE